MGFKIKNHGEAHVCAAASMLVINTINSIEALTPLGKNGFRCEYNQKGGYITFMLKNQQEREENAGLLLDAMVLGLESIKEAHPDEIRIINN